MSSKREGSGIINEVNPDVREWCTFLSTHIAHRLAHYNCYPKVT